MLNFSTNRIRIITVKHPSINKMIKLDNNIFYILLKSKLSLNIANFNFSLFLLWTSGLYVGLCQNNFSLIKYHIMKDLFNSCVVTSIYKYKNN